MRHHRVLLVDIDPQASLTTFMGKEMAKLESSSERTALLEEAIAQSLSLSQIRERVKAGKPPKETEELQTRFDTTIKQIKKSSVWSNPKKRKKLESLLAQMSALIAESN